MRREQDLTQEYIAALMEISPTSYARIERGEIQPKIEKLQQLAQILKVDVNELLEHEDKSVLLSVNGSSDFSAPGGLEFLLQPQQLLRQRCACC